MKPPLEWTGHGRVSLAVVPDARVGTVKGVLLDMASVGIEDLALRADAESDAGWRLGPALDFNGSEPSAALLRDLLFEEVTTQHAAAYREALRATAAGEADAYTAAMGLLSVALAPGEAA